jgi:hypothetical protein
MDKSALRTQMEQPVNVGNIKCITSKSNMLDLYLYPLIIIALTTFLLYICYDSFTANKAKDNTILVFSLVLPLLLVVYLNAKYKFANVALTENGLLLSGIITKEEIKFSQIESINNYSVRTPTRLTIKLKNKSVFGKNISFIPVNDLVEGELLLLLRQNQK